MRTFGGAKKNRIFVFVLHQFFSFLIVEKIKMSKFNIEDWKTHHELYFKALKKELKANKEKWESALGKGSNGKLRMLSSLANRPPIKEKLKQVFAIKDDEWPVKTDNNAPYASFHTYVSNFLDKSANRICL